MKKSIQMMSLLLASALTLPVLASCSGGSSTEDTTTGTDSQTETVSTAQTDDPTSTPTAPSSDEIQAALAENSYANAGLTLTLKVIKDYYSTRTHYLRSERGGSGQSTVWGYASFLEALSTTYALYPDNETVKKTYVDALTNGVDKYKVTKATITNTQTKERFKNITYYNASAGGSGDYYYDDNAWICIQFLYAYELLQDEEYLNRAKELLTFFWTGWDDSLGGGIYWDKSYSGKNTCADGPIAICYLWAYQLTQEEDYLTKGTQIYSWMKETLRDSNYLYKDALGLDGGENSWKADYNQGTPIYAACLLYEITGDESYLKDAKQTAQAALGLAFTSSGRGTNQTVKMNGNPIYKSWCVGWLMRGFMRYVQDSKKAGSYFSYMETVLDKVIAAVDSDGYYDPYFLTGDWGSESVTDVLQPSGVATVMMLCAYYDVYIAPSL